MTATTPSAKLRMVTVSSTYGCGGSLVGPKLAERVGLPFADRLIPPRGSTEVPSAEESLTDAKREIRSAVAGCWTVS